MFVRIDADFYYSKLLPTKSLRLTLCLQTCSRLSHHIFDIVDSTVWFMACDSSSKRFKTHKTSIFLMLFNFQYFSNFPIIFQNYSKFPISNIFFKFSFSNIFPNFHFPISNIFPNFHFAVRNVQLPVFRCIFCSFSFKIISQKIVTLSQAKKKLLSKRSKESGKITKHWPTFKTDINR